MVLQCVVTSGYVVSAPNGDNGINWGAYGPQLLTWSRVDTDAEFFAVVLTNADRNTLPHNIVLNAHVDGTRFSTYILPPYRNSFPKGDHFRINLVKSVEEQDIIYAQSNEFSTR
ncbi:fruit-body specific protein D [Linnemannia elongata]|nr:fruit-body specific protein D [Linnemannia elongata]